MRNLELENKALLEIVNALPDHLVGTPGGEEAHAAPLTPNG